MRKIVITSLALIIFFSVTLITLSQPLEYALQSDVINHGSTSATAANYKLVSTVGQTNVGTMQGSAYHLTNGFLQPNDTLTPPVSEQNFVYLPITIR